ncbi:MAG: tRNA 2-thiocytidine biosynthesis protein TtcA [Lachnospiraceae bacterium]|nr:tRNA 2-thiocytidine biosynthesis protein TtcA [Lachnospiraceae bacterium]
MPKELTRVQKIERSIIKTYREELWHPFIDAVTKYELISEGDRIAVCISGGKDSMLMAKLMQEIERHGRVPFENVFLVMDPGYNPENRALIEENAAALEIPVTILPSNIFDVAYSQEKGSPCYLCAKMRRGFLYNHAKQLGCNKIALGHHFDDVIETTVMSMFYSSQIRAMLPKLHSDNFEGMELIRPLYKVHEADIIRWANYNGLHFLRCACRFTEQADAGEDGSGVSKRKEIKDLIRRMKRETPDLDQSIFNSIHSVCLDTMPGWQTRGEKHSFLEHYN